MATGLAGFFLSASFFFAYYHNFVFDWYKFAIALQNCTIFF